MIILEGNSATNMKLLLDTHALLWALFDPDQL